MAYTPYVGEIMAVPFDFAPHGWALCDGRVMSISENTALYALIGTTYGGDGKTTFCLPDLQGRAPVGAGQGAGLSDRKLGAMGGEEFTTLVEANMPRHTHTVNVNNSDSGGNTVDPTGAQWAKALVGRVATNLYEPGTITPTHPGQMSKQALSIAGGPRMHDNMPPYLTLNFVIALQGIFPPKY